MNDYDFSTLNDKEFENISLDLISRDRDKRYERFKVGKDGGVDGRFYRDDGKEEIVQCKHYLKTGFSGLISSLKKKNSSGNTESDKVKILNPERYIFITSLPLSRANKQEIKDIFNPYIRKDNDIYGQEDLNDLLKNNSDIEENHYKLWISSTTVLKRILNNAIKGRSEFKIEEIEERIKYYVVTDNHAKAIKKLEESHTIIIAGEPGIGKSTLAEQMALFYIDKGFSFYNIEDSLKEAEDVFDKDAKQIYYFDDFLGSNFLEALAPHKDSHIINFIARIKKDENKRFILTSRTTIFNQSLLLSDTLKNKHIDSHEFILDFKSLEDMDKAKILYNHMWHSSLNDDYINEIYKDKRYHQIISHKNFNPRIIDFITNINIQNEVSIDRYWDDIVRHLDNPQKIWEQTFDVGSDNFMRSLVVLTVFNGNSIDEDTLRSAYDTFNTLTNTQNTSYQSQEFDSTIKKVMKYYLNRSIDRHQIIRYSLFNPSIADFVINRYKKNNNNLINVFLSLKTGESIRRLIGLLSNKYIDFDSFQKIINVIEFSIDDKMDYIVELLHLFYLIHDEDFILGDRLQDIKDLLGIIMKKDGNINQVYKILESVNCVYNKKTEMEPELLNKIIKSVEYDDESDIVELVNFLDDDLFSSEKFEESVGLLNSLLEEYILEGIKSEDYNIKDSVATNTKYEINKIINNSVGYEVNEVTITLQDRIGSRYFQNIDIEKIQNKVKIELLEDIKSDFSYYFSEDTDDKPSVNKIKNIDDDLDKNFDIDDLFSR